MFAPFEDGDMGEVGCSCIPGNLPMVGHTAVMHNWTSSTSQQLIKPNFLPLLPAPYSLLLIPCSLTDRADRAPVAAIDCAPSEVHAVGVARMDGAERTRPVVGVRPSIAERASAHATHSGQED